MVRIGFFSYTHLFCLYFKVTQLTLYYLVFAGSSRNRKKKWNTDLDFVYLLPKKKQHRPRAFAPSLQPLLSKEDLSSPPTRESLKMDIIKQESASIEDSDDSNHLVNGFCTTVVTSPSETSQQKTRSSCEDENNTLPTTTLPVFHRKDRRANHHQKSAKRKKSVGGFNGDVATIKQRVPLQQAKLVFKSNSPDSRVLSPLRDESGEIKSFLPLPFVEPRIVGATSLFNSTTSAFLVSPPASEQLPFGSVSNGVADTVGKQRITCKSENLWPSDSSPPSWHVAEAGLLNGTKQTSTSLLTDLKTGLRNVEGEIDPHLDTTRSADLCNNNKEMKQGHPTAKSRNEVKVNVKLEAELDETDYGKHINNNNIQEGTHCMNKSDVVDYKDTDNIVSHFKQDNIVSPNRQTRPRARNSPRTNTTVRIKSEADSPSLLSCGEPCPVFSDPHSTDFHTPYVFKGLNGCHTNTSDKKHIRNSFNEPRGESVTQKNDKFCARKGKRGTREMGVVHKTVKLVLDRVDKSLSSQEYNITFKGKYLWPIFVINCMTLAFL